MFQNSGQTLSEAKHNPQASQANQLKSQYGVSGWFLAVFNRLGLVEIEYIKTTNVIYIHAGKSLLFLLFALIVLYILPITMCSPQALYTDSEALSNFQQKQYVSYYHQLQSSISTQLPTNLYTLGESLRFYGSKISQFLWINFSKLRHVVCSDTTLYDVIKRLDEFNALHFYEEDQQRILSPLSISKLLKNSFQWIVENTALIHQNDTIDALQSPVSTFFTSAKPALRQNLFCTSLYNTQESVAYYLHQCLNIIVQTHIIIGNIIYRFLKQLFFSANNDKNVQLFDTLQFYDECDYWCGYYHLKQRLSHIVFPDHPPWPLLRFGQPIANVLEHLFHLIIPAEDRVMMETTIFLRSSIIHAITSLEIADAMHWYKTGYLYGEWTSIETLLGDYSDKLQYINTINDNIKNSNIFGQTLHNAYHLGKEFTSLRGIHIKDLAVLTCTHQDALQRMLLAAASYGFFTEIAPNRWENTQLSIVLRRPERKHQDVKYVIDKDEFIQIQGTDVTIPRYEAPYKSLAWTTLMFGNEQFVAMSNLAYTVETNTPSFSRVYGDFWRYHDLSKEAFLDNRRQQENEQIQQKIAAGQRLGVCQRYDLSIPAAPDREDNNNVLADEQNVENDSAYTQQQQQQNNNNNNNKEKIIEKKLKKLPFTEPVENTPTGTLLTNNVKAPLLNAYLEFNNAMESIATTTVSGLTSDNALFHQFDTFIDIAGGKGHLLTHLAYNNYKFFTQDKTKKYDLFDKLRQFGGEGNYMVPLTRGIVFDLPYTYANQDTVKEIITNFQHIFSISPDEPSHNNVFTQCIQSSARPEPNSVAIINSVSTKSQNDDDDDGENNNNIDQNICPQLIIHQGSFFTPNSFPSVVEISNDIILTKIYQQLQQSRVYDAIKNDFKSSYTYYKNNFNKKTYKEQKDAQITVHALHQTGLSLMQILHDWDDFDSIRILQSIHTAMVEPFNTLVHKFIHNDNVEKKQTKFQHDVKAMNKHGNDYRQQDIFESAQLYQIMCEYLPQIDKNQQLSYIFEDKIFNDIVQDYCQYLNTPVDATVETNKEIFPVKFSLTHNIKLFVIDRLLPDLTSSIVSTHGSPLVDMLMMNNFNGARERTIAMFKNVLQNGGWDMLTIHPSRFMFGVVEAIPQWNVKDFNTKE